MTPNFIRWGLVFLLGTLAFAFTQCGKPFAEKGDLIYSVDGVFVPVAGGNAQTSLAAFEQTVYPLTRANCASCHATAQQPLHANSNVETAHNAILAGYKVNFTTPSASRMVAKLRNESHNCWGNCAANAQEMEDAIEEWATMMATGDEDPPGGTADFTIVTSQSSTIAQIRQQVTAGAVIMTAPAQSAMLTAPMIYNGTMTPGFIEVPNDGQNLTLANNDASAGRAVFTMSSTQARTGGALWGLVNATANNDDSLFFSLNGQATPTQWNINTTNGRFMWMRMPNNHNVVAGTNTITIREREDGTKLAMILWTQDQNFVPTGSGTAGMITLRFPLSSLLGGTAGVELEVRLDDYDSYSYRLTSLRINNTSTSSVYVKNIRLLLNGAYNPQHANFTFVDQIVPPGGAALTPSSMIILKDKGEAVDKLSFAFERLELSSGGASGNVGGGVGAQ